MLSSATFLGSLAVEINLPINDIRHIATITDELHHFLASTCHLRPTGLRIGILLKTSEFVAVQNEVHLPQTFLGSSPNGVMLFP